MENKPNQENTKNPKFCKNCSKLAKDVEKKHQEEIKRLFAEMLNTQKRFRAELEEQDKFKNFDLISELLETKDILNMALMFKSNNPETKKFLVGVQMVENQLKNLLTKFNVKKIETKINDSFNPEFHESIGFENVETEKDNIILKISKDGYLLHNRLLRPAKVIINQKIILKKSEKEKEKEKGEK